MSEVWGGRAAGPGHACQRCAGEFSLGLSEAGAAVNLDFAALHPGGWGKFAGLEVRRDSVELLKSMGVTAIRQGGSFTDPEYYFWKRGPGGALRCLVCVCVCVCVYWGGTRFTQDSRAGQYLSTGVCCPLFTGADLINSP